MLSFSHRLEWTRVSRPQHRAWISRPQPHSVPPLVSHLWQRPPISQHSKWIKGFSPKAGKFVMHQMEDLSLLITIPKPQRGWVAFSTWRVTFLRLLGDWVEQVPGWKPLLEMAGRRPLSCRQADLCWNAVASIQLQGKEADTPDTTGPCLSSWKACCLGLIWNFRVILPYSGCWLAKGEKMPGYFHNLILRGSEA